MRDQSDKNVEALQPETTLESRKHMAPQNKIREENEKKTRKKKRSKTNISIWKSVLLKKTREEAFFRKPHRFSVQCPLSSAISTQVKCLQLKGTVLVRVLASRDSNTLCFATQ